MTSNSVTFRVGSEMFQTSYTIFGDLKSTARSLVVLNDGPGIFHSYMLPHADLYKTHDSLVVLYDQLGTGASTHVREARELFHTGAFRRRAAQPRPAPHRQRL